MERRSLEEVGLFCLSLSCNQRIVQDILENKKEKTTFVGLFFLDKGFQDNLVSELPGSTQRTWKKTRCWRNWSRRAQFSLEAGWVEFSPIPRGFCPLSYWKAPKYFWPLQQTDGIVHFVSMKGNTKEIFSIYIFKQKPLQSPGGTSVKLLAWTKLSTNTIFNTFNYSFLHLKSAIEFSIWQQWRWRWRWREWWWWQTFDQRNLRFSVFIRRTVARFQLHCPGVAPPLSRSHPESWTENKWGKGS